MKYCLFDGTFFKQINNKKKKTDKDTQFCKLNEILLVFMYRNKYFHFQMKRFEA